jgi:chromosome segregation ATPase
MTSTLIDLISDMRICLGLALGTGLIIGYLYTKFKARELFKPDIKNLKRKIIHNETEANSLSAKNSEVETELELYSGKLHESNLEVTKSKNEISDLESNIHTLETEGTKIKDQYQKQEHVLNRYSNEVQKLKTTLGVEDISDIENQKSTLKANAIQIVDTYQQKCDSCEGMYNEEKALKRENSDLSSKISSLAAAYNKKELELAEATQKVSTIREKLQLEFDKILANKEENEIKIENYKKQLLEIKEKLS